MVILARDGRRARFAQRNFGALSRPFADPGALLLERLLARRPKPGETSEAEIRWGAAGSFGADLLDERNVSFRLEDDDDPLDEPPEGPKLLEFNEISRNTTTVRVENPDDPEQHVFVERIEDITFSGPDGVFRKFILKNK